MRLRFLVDLPLELKSQGAETETLILNETVNQCGFISLSELEKEYIRKVLEATGGNKSKAARILGIHPTSLFRKLKSMM